MLNIENLCFSYHENKQKIIEGLNLNIKEGNFVSLIGPIGCGKTTLLKIIAGLIPINEGSILIAGKSVNESSLKVGMVFQKPILLGWKTVKDNIILPFKLTGRNYENKFIDEFIFSMGMSEFKDLFPHELSIGMRQLASYSMSMVLNPPILLMDEPFSSIDSITKEKILLSLIELWETSKKTVLYVTHNITEAVVLSDEVIILSRDPMKVKRIIPIALERPRSYSMLNDPELFKISNLIRQELGI